MKKIIYTICSLAFLMSCDTSTEIIKVGERSYQLAFEDNFDTPSVDESIWDYRTDSKHWSTQQKENLRQADGVLYLDLKKENALDKEYTGAGLITKERFSYGYYESSMKIPNGAAGWHTSFWLMGHDGSGGTSTGKTALEIDIVENDSNDPNGYKVNFHRWKGKHISRGWKYIEHIGFASDFQKVACEYRSDSVKFYLNDVLVQRVNISDMPKSDVNIWLTSIASHLGNTDKVDDDKLPASAMFEYVKYYRLID